MWKPFVLIPMPGMPPVRFETQGEWKAAVESMLHMFMSLEQVGDDPPVFHLNLTHSGKNLKRFFDENDMDPGQIRMLFTKEEGDWIPEEISAFGSFAPEHADEPRVLSGSDVLNLEDAKNPRIQIQTPPITFDTFEQMATQEILKAAFNKLRGLISSKRLLKEAFFKVHEAVGLYCRMTLNESMHSWKVMQFVQQVVDGKPDLVFEAEELFKVFLHVHAEWVTFFEATKDGKTIKEIPEWWKPYLAELHNDETKN